MKPIRRGGKERLAIGWMHCFTLDTADDRRRHRYWKRQARRQRRRNLDLLKNVEHRAALRRGGVPVVRARQLRLRPSAPNGEGIRGTRR